MTMDQDRARADLQRRALTGAVWTLTHTITSIPVAFAVNVLVARVLGAEGFGRLAYLTALMGIATVIVSAGVEVGLIQFGAKAHARGDTAEVRRLLSRSQGFRLLWAAPILTTLILWLGSAPIGLLIAAAVFGVWLPAAIGGATACLTIENRTDRAAQIAMIVNVLTQAAVVASLYVLETADGVWMSRLIVAGVGPTIAIFAISGSYRRAVLSVGAPWRLPRAFWRFALPAGASGIVGMLALDRTEVVVLEHLSQPEQVGLYALAFGLAGHAFAPAHALLNPLTPAISGLREVDAPAIGRAFLRVVRTSATVCGGIVAVGAPTLALLVPVLYGSEFADAAGMVFVLVASSGLTVLTYPMGVFVLARLRGGSLLRMDSFSLGVIASIALLLVPLVGAWGAVIAKMFLGLSRFLWLMLTEQDSFGTSRLATVAAARPIFIGVVAASLAYGAVVVTPGPVGLLVVGAALISSAVFIVGLRVLRAGVTRSDVDALGGVRPRILRASLLGAARAVAWAREPARAGKE